MVSKSKIVEACFAISLALGISKPNNKLALK